MSESVCPASVALNHNGSLRAIEIETPDEGVIKTVAQSRVFRVQDGYRYTMRWKPYIEVTWVASDIPGFSGRSHVGEVSVGGITLRDLCERPVAAVQISRIGSVAIFPDRIAYYVAEKNYRALREFSVRELGDRRISGAFLEREGPLLVELRAEGSSEISYARLEPAEGWPPEAPERPGADGGATGRYILAAGLMAALLAVGGVALFQKLNSLPAGE